MAIAENLSAVARGLYVLVALCAFALAGRGYLYCHMAGRAMESCCCKHASITAASDFERDEVVTRRCCERRGDAALPTANAPSRAEASFDAPLAIVSPVCLRPAPRVERAIDPQHPPTTIEARAGPRREGKRRAQLGVMRC